jgi:hypothetical protein
MLINALKISLLTYFRNLGLYDYLAFGWLVLTFLFLIVLAILIARRSSALSVLLIVVAILLVIVSPFLIQYKLNSLLRPTVVELTMVKKLIFSDTLIVEADLYNHAKKPTKHCLIQTTVIKENGTQGFKAWLNRLKPIAIQSILVQENIPTNESNHIRIVLDDFTYDHEVNATVKAECY